MELPLWNDPKRSDGSMVRGALWLVQVVGVGNVFTKNQLREAFPRVSQIDRRIRDLREYGWVLHTSSEDASLQAEDQRFVRAGIEVWDQMARRNAPRQRAITSKERQAILARDEYMCTLCGISGAESYPDDPVKTAVISVFRRSVLEPDGKISEVLQTECSRCRSGSTSSPSDLSEVLAAARELELSERRRLLVWVDRGRRGMTGLDRAWAAFLRVPSERRAEVVESLHRELG